MTAMILAAGEGSRLRPLTDHTPKPMLRICGRPILEHGIRLLTKHGIRDLVINLHHRPEEIRAYFGDGAAWGASIRYSFEPHLLGTAGAVRKVQEVFDQTFLVLYGDNLTDCDLDRLRTFHQSRRAMATIALFRRENVSASGIAELADDDRIVRFVEKPQADAIFSHWVNAGLLVLEPAVLTMIPPGRPADFGRDVLPGLLANGYPVYGYRMREHLWWIDTIEDYERVDQLCKSGELRLS
jgi:mannose-1-phosphate guanylyltransferase/phosphomannomutase